MGLPGGKLSEPQNLGSEYKERSFIQRALKEELAMLVTSCTFQSMLEKQKVECSYLKWFILIPVMTDIYSLARLDPSNARETKGGFDCAFQ